MDFAAGMFQVYILYVHPFMLAVVVVRQYFLLPWFGIHQGTKALHYHDASSIMACHLYQAI